MSPPFSRFVSRILIACMILLPLQANAALIGTDQAVSAAQVLAARDKVAALLERVEVARQLQTLGLSPQAAQVRANALSDLEISQLAGQIDNLPAGANSTGWVLVLLTIALLLWLFVK